MLCWAIFNVAYYRNIFDNEQFMEVPETGDRNNVSLQESQNSAIYAGRPCIGPDTDN